MSNINKEEILKGSKWVRFIFMLGYAFVINFEYLVLNLENQTIVHQLF